MALRLSREGDYTFKQQADQHELRKRLIKFQDGTSSYDAVSSNSAYLLRRLFSPGVPSLAPAASQPTSPFSPCTSHQPARCMPLHTANEQNYAPYLLLQETLEQLGRKVNITTTHSK